MYFFSGGGYGGWWETDGLTNGCSTVGISKTQPVEILEQHYPLVFEEYALREGSSGAGRHRGGYGVSYRVRLLRGSRHRLVPDGPWPRRPPGLRAACPAAARRSRWSAAGTPIAATHLQGGDLELTPATGSR